MSLPGETAHTPGDVLWTPTDEERSEGSLAAFTRWLADDRGLTFSDYGSLWTWSTEEIEDFWGAVWEHFEVGTHQPDLVLRSRAMPGADWFPGARLNYAQEMLNRANRTGPALISVRENGPVVEHSHAELEAKVGALAATLRELGVQPGDRVAAFLPNVPEALVGLLATAAIGAVWTSCSPDFGTQSVLDRFAQVEPVVLLAADGYRFNGRRYDRRAVVEQLKQALPSLRATIVVSVLGDGQVPGTTSWERATSGSAPLVFEDVPFSHPLWILFSSGTTGTPKGIVHSHGGIVLEHLKSVGLGCGIGPGDRFFFFSSTSWMVWNWLVGGLLVGAVPVLYDGSPGFPDASGNWQVAACTGAAVFGTGAAYLTASEKAALRPAADLDLSALRSIISTGSPLPTSTWSWVYDQFDDRVRLDSSSGGTDVCGGLVSGSPWLPVRLGEISGACLGVKAQAFNEAGQPVTGEVGELVIREPMPSMPVRFWADPDGERYREAYFDRFPGVWCHGDWIEFTSTGGAIISGRSDATLNKAGVRMGSADIYALVDPLQGVTDSLVLGIELPDGGYYMPLFVVLEPDAQLDEVTDRIRTTIRTDLSPRHLPDEILEAPAVPRTRTGKRLEIPIKRILRGSGAPTDIADGALSEADTSALRWYEAFGRERIQPLLSGPTSPVGPRRSA